MKAPKPGAWVRLSLDSLRAVGCSKSAAVILALIADKATDSDQRRAKIEQAELVQLSGCSRRTVIRAVEQLAALDLIRVRRCPGRASVYELTERVELPAKQRTTEEQRRRAEQRRAARLQAEQAAAEQAEYLSLVNRFREDD